MGTPLSEATLRRLANNPKLTSVAFQRLLDAATALSCKQKKAIFALHRNTVRDAGMVENTSSSKQQRAAAGVSGAKDKDSKQKLIQQRRDLEEEKRRLQKHLQDEKQSLS